MSVTSNLALPCARPPSGACCSLGFALSRIGLFDGDVAFLRQPLQQLIDAFGQFRLLVFLPILEHLPHQVVRDFPLLLEGFEQRLVQLLHGAFLVHFVEIGILAVKPAVQEEILKEFQQVLGAEVVERMGNVPGVFDEFHGALPLNCT